MGTVTGRSVHTRQDHPRTAPYAPSSRKSFQMNQIPQTQPVHVLWQRHASLSDQFCTPYKKSPSLRYLSLLYMSVSLCLGETGQRKGRADSRLKTTIIEKQSRTEAQGDCKFSMNYIQRMQQVGRQGLLTLQSWTTHAWRPRSGPCQIQGRINDKRKPPFHMYIHTQT